MRISIDQVLEAVESGEYIGICIACGHEQEGVEPDARAYSCESCDARKVYGAEELLMLVGVTSPSAIERLF